MYVCTHQILRTITCVSCKYSVIFFAYFICLLYYTTCWILKLLFCVSCISSSNSISKQHNCLFRNVALPVLHGIFFHYFLVSFSSVFLGNNIKLKCLKLQEDILTIPNIQIILFVFVFVNNDIRTDKFFISFTIYLWSNKIKGNTTDRQNNTQKRFTNEVIV